MHWEYMTLSIVIKVDPETLQEQMSPELVYCLLKGWQPTSPPWSMLPGEILVTLRRTVHD
jgi:hypothetical protein